MLRLTSSKKGIILMIFSSLFACMGQLLFKLAAGQGAVFIFGGFCFYVTGAFTMLTAYKYGELSVLQPILSLNYIIGLIFGSLVFKETISVMKVVGVFVIMCGVIMIAIGERE